ncbi:hypothetical protein BDV59DRAFT_175894 [Aspergillus ambiguus]|uniref:uncharacterized protein n=1 Tax=Aspergillus ambiguus TaxID=176160 RepID=UPI003CCE3148
MRRSRSPRNRSPRLVADTWVPSSTRTYGRMRSRSPPPFRRRSRSPPLYSRDTGKGAYSKGHSPPRRFSPRREGRPRSPPPSSWRSRSPYSESRSRGISRGRATPNRPRDLSPPNQDFRSSRRPLPSPNGSYRRSSPHSRRGLLREDVPRNPVARRSRSPFQPGRTERYADKFPGQRRRSPSPRGASYAYSSAPGSVPNSRRSSPFADRVNTLPSDTRGRSPFDHRRMSKNSENSQSYSDRYPERTPPIRPRPNRDEHRQRSPNPDQSTSRSGRVPDPDVYDPNRTTGDQGMDLSRFSTSSPVNIPSHPRASSTLPSQSPPSGPSHGVKSLHGRGSNLSLLSAPTRPRGGTNLKENAWGGTTVRRGSGISSHTPPTGPRGSQMPSGPADPHRYNTYRQGSNAGVPHPRTPKYTNHLAGLPSVIPGGRLWQSNIDVALEKRLSQLDADRDRLLDQVSDCQRQKRMGIRDWERLDRESSICALKSELAEGHLQRITDGESVQAAAIF